MKTLFPLLAALAALLGIALAGPAELKLKDGSVLKGELAPLKAGERTEVVVTTEYGVVRVPVEKLTDETKLDLGLSKPKSSREYETEIRVLETRIKVLQEENARLRMELAAGGAKSDGSTPPPAPASLTPHIPPPQPRRATPPPSSVSPVPSSQPAPPSVSASYSLSKSGIRHNSRCRYFHTGSACSATDGRACKICGG